MRWRSPCPLHKIQDNPTAPQSGPRPSAALGAVAVKLQSLSSNPPTSTSLLTVWTGTGSSCKWAEPRSELSD